MIREMKSADGQSGHGLLLAQKPPIPHICLRDFSHSGQTAVLENGLIKVFCFFPHIDRSCAVAMAAGLQID